MSRQANGGGRPQCDDKERQPLGAGRVCESHHRGQNVLRIPLVPERIPAVENEKTLTRVSDKQEFSFIVILRRSRRIYLSISLLQILRCAQNDKAISIYLTLKGDHYSIQRKPQKFGLYCKFVYICNVEGEDCAASSIRKKWLNN